MLRPRPFLTLALLAAAAMPARAQVTVDLHALDQLHGGAQTSPSHLARNPPKPRKSQHTAEKPARHKPPPPSEAAEHRKYPAPAATEQPTAAPPPATAAAPPPPPAVLPGGPPPPPVRLTPIEPEPASAQSPPAAKPDAPVVAADAGGGPAPIKEGVRVTFDGGRSDLSPASEAGLKSFVAAAPKSDATSFNVLGFAAGAPEDPSTPRRLSLSRALAVRSVLMAQGIASTRIYVRALGGAPPGAPPDRVDVTVSGGNGP